MAAQAPDFESWYKGLPPVTRALGTGWAGTVIGMSLGFVPIRQLYLDWELVLKQFNVWRLFTNFLVIGKLSFGTLIKLVMLFQYGKQLEAGAYDGKPADMIFFVAFCMAGLIGMSGAMAFLVPYYANEFAFNGTALLVCVVYLWAREYPTATVSFYGIFPLQSYYMPFAFAVGDLLFGKSLFPHIFGILVAHAYYFMHSLYPRRTGKVVLHTPAWCRALATQLGWSRPAPGTPGAANPNYRAFQGRGYRLHQN